jgi:Ni,Fe-hydrogenase III large subunit
MCACLDDTRGRLCCTSGTVTVAVAPALSYALVGNIVPDLPLCNKSFNQSYSGNDL